MRKRHASSRMGKRIARLRPRLPLHKAKRRLRRTNWGKSTAVTMTSEACERCVIFFDTAEVYGMRASIDLVREALALFRDNVKVSNG